VFDSEGFLERFQKEDWLKRVLILGGSLFRLIGKPFPFNGLTFV